MNFTDYQELLFLQRIQVQCILAIQQNNICDDDYFVTHTTEVLSKPYIAYVAEDEGKLERRISTVTMPGFAGLAKHPEANCVLSDIDIFLDYALPGPSFLSPPTMSELPVGLVVYDKHDHNNRFYLSFSLNNMQPVVSLMGTDTKPGS